MALPSSQVQSRFPGLSEVRSVDELVEKLKVLGPDVANLLHLAEKRQKVGTYCHLLPWVTTITGTGSEEQTMQ